MRSGDGNGSLGKAFRPSSHGDVSEDRRHLHPATLEERKRRAAKYAKEMEEQGQWTYLPSQGSGQSA